jgi:hypothetical protein
VATLTLAARAHSAALDLDDRIVSLASTSTSS